MEPDHAANIAAVCEKYKDLQIVTNGKTKNMLPQFFETDYSSRVLEVKEGDTLELGTHTLTFIMAPMVHWPEVMVEYESREKVLFSADGFGKFGTLDTEEDWDCEARRYYMNIVGKYGMQVQALLKKQRHWILRRSVRFMDRFFRKIWDITLENTRSGPVMNRKMKGLPLLTLQSTEIRQRPLRKWLRFWSRRDRKCRCLI